MTSSREPHAELPPALSSMWRLCKLGYRHEPGMMATAFGLALLSALPDALIALWLALLGSGLVAGDMARVRLASLGLALSAVATWFLRIVNPRSAPVSRQATIASNRTWRDCRHRSPRLPTTSGPTS
jgi:ATP-binding cassette subfamily B protein